WWHVEFDCHWLVLNPSVRENGSQYEPLRAGGFIVYQEWDPKGIAASDAGLGAPRRCELLEVVSGPEFLIERPRTAQLHSWFVHRQGARGLCVRDASRGYPFEYVSRDGGSHQRLPKDEIRWSCRQFAPLLGRQILRGVEAPRLFPVFSVGCP